MFDGLDGNAESISINDFSTLYTLFDHEHLLGNISWLLSKLSKNKGMQYISVGHKRAWWSASDTGKFRTFPVAEVVEMVEYLVRSTYIKAFGHNFRQVKGIIMGGKSSGWLSDCSLMVDEFKYIDVKIRNNERAEAVKLRNFDRYRDDCTVCNFNNFPNITSQIYPPSLTLTQENDSDCAATVLDMDVKIIENRFVTKVYCKTDYFPFDVISLPFLESNINGRLCYLVFYGQVLRFQRLCTHKGDFEDRAKLLADTLIDRKFDKVKLRTQFCRVVNKYMCEFQKWQVPTDILNWFNQILNPTTPEPDVSLGTLNLPLDNPADQIVPYLNPSTTAQINHPIGHINTITDSPSQLDPLVSPQKTNSSQTIPLTYALRPCRHINYKV